MKLTTDSVRKQPTKTSEEQTQQFHGDDVHYPVLGSTSDLSCREGNLLSQSEALPRSFLRDHFVGKPVAVFSDEQLPLSYG